MDIKINKLSSFIEGLKKPLIIAGPCSAETNEQIISTAKELKKNSINIFRAGIWKPRTRPNSFEGVGNIGLQWLNNVQKEVGLKVMTEVANAKHVEQVLKHDIDMIWIGARTTVNPFAVQEIADALRGVDIPVFIKNPINPDMRLWLGAIERLSNVGCESLVAVHRGFFSYGSKKYRNLPHWQLPVELKRIIPNIPIICDPSHIAGSRDLIQSVSQKAIDLNFDGLMIETHIDPDNALSDKNQQITPSFLNNLLSELVVRHKSIDDKDFALSLEELRTKIDTLDNDLINTLMNRMNIAELIGKHKKENDVTILQPLRWKYILENRTSNGIDSGLSKEFMTLLLRAIHEESINIQTGVMNNKKRK